MVEFACNGRFEAMIRINIHFDEAYPKDDEMRAYFDGLLYALTTGRDRKFEAVICSSRRCDINLFPAVTPFGIMRARKDCTHVPNVVCVHDDTLSDISGLSSARQISSHQIMDFYRQADYLVVVSEKTAEKLESIGFDHAKITVIGAYPDPADPDGKKERREVTANWDAFLQKVYEQSASRLKRLSKKVI